MPQKSTMDSLDIMKAKVSAKGWVVIPASLRKRYGLKPGTIVEFRELGDRLFIIPKVSDVVEELYGKFAGETSLTKALLEDREKDLKREETNIKI